MSNKPKDGGPAFPATRTEQLVCEVGGRGRVDRVDVDYPGMSLRDWFAGQAIAATIRAEESFVTFFDGPRVAANAYYIADAMLAERGKR